MPGGPWGFFADISREILLRSLALVGTPSLRGAAYRAGGTADARRAMGFFADISREIHSSILLARSCFSRVSARSCVQRRRNWECQEGPLLLFLATILANLSLVLDIPSLMH